MRKAWIILSLFTFISATTSVAANHGPEEVKFKAQNGTVTYMHTQHSEYGAECSSCHHEGVLSGTCRRCHDGKQAPTFKDIAHKLCKECHAKNKGPTECKGCHVK